jgi:hypothetical protein
VDGYFGILYPIHCTVQRTVVCTVYRLLYHAVKNSRRDHRGWLFWYSVPCTRYCTLYNVQYILLYQLGMPGGTTMDGYGILCTSAVFTMYRLLY